ncbi:structural protein [Cellulophaga phage Omtje_3]|uniref:Structural protein n=1 Tax=Cellulophaga phage Omtje_1 TaxID=2745694 RepID=A0A8E4ZLM3_9VIRU|nr:structural protein [Cellulophaga phage Omtje_1]QQV90360.1 structural protein [Cellulophaga phage Omtje_2]QQV90373.1 structural protein [Cellulophaga phage Omtje_3]QQV90386.1 structural protein [Cellulophaga phage Omtje_4]QQV90399.1 structural protein [Cellulophaga phage Omtje_5]
MKAINTIIKLISTSVKYAGIVLVVVEILQFSKEKLSEYNSKTVIDEVDIK